MLFTVINVNDITVNTRVMARLIMLHIKIRKAVCIALIVMRQRQR